MKIFKIIFAIFVSSFMTMSCEPEELPEQDKMVFPIKADTDNEELPVDDKG